MSISYPRHHGWFESFNKFIAWSFNNTVASSLFSIPCSCAALCACSASCGDIAFDIVLAVKQV